MVAATPLSPDANSFRSAPAEKNFSPEPVTTCQRLARLDYRQWQDAFRAGGYQPMLAERYIRSFKQKVAEGLELR